MINDTLGLLSIRKSHTGDYVEIDRFLNGLIKCVTLHFNVAFH